MADDFVPPWEQQTSPPSDSSGYGPVYGGPTGVPRIDIPAQTSRYVPPWEAPADKKPTGIVTQALSGVMEGAQNLPGTIPRLTALAGQGIDYLTGNKEAQAEDAQRAALAASIQKNMPSVTNVLPQPANTAEQYARTAGNFIPGALAGPGGASRVITQGVLPGLASEAAGQTFKPTPYEAEARAIAPVISGLRGGAAGAAEREASVAVPTTQELRSAARGPTGYKAAETGAIFEPDRMEQLASNIRGVMNEGGSRDYIAPGVYRAIDELKGENSVEGVQKVRSLVGGIGERGDREAKYAAKMAKDEIDKFLQESAPDQAAILERARGNDAAAFRSEKIENAIATAGLNKGSAGYGGNAVNAARQAIKPFVKKYIAGKKQGFNQEEFEAMRDFVEGNTKSNLLRMGGVLAPEKGALSLGVAGELASKVTESIPGMAAVMAGISFLGRASNKLADRVSQEQLNKLQELIRKRSPAYEEAVKAAGNRYADSMDAFAASPSQQNFIRFVVASRNLANGFKRDGVNISSGDLIRQFTPATAGANEQDQQKQ